MDIANVIIAVGGLLLGGSGIGTFMFYKANNKAKEIANEGSSAHQWKELYEKQLLENEKIIARYEEKIAEKDRQLAEKDRKIEKNHTEKGKYITTIIRLKERLSRYSVLRCDEIGCGTRKPPIQPIELSDTLEINKLENNYNESTTTEERVLCR